MKYYTRLRLVNDNTHSKLTISTKELSKQDAIDFVRKQYPYWRLSSGGFIEGTNKIGFKIGWEWIEKK